MTMFYPPGRGGGREKDRDRDRARDRRPESPKRGGRRRGKRNPPSLPAVRQHLANVSLGKLDKLSIYLSIHPSIYLSISLSLSVCLSVYLPVYLQAWKRSYSARLLHFSKLTTSKAKQFCETSSIFELDNVKNEAILQDFLFFQSWQHKKRSNSARRPQYFNLTTSKTKQFCETSSFFEVDNIKNKRILRDFLQKWKVESRADGLVPMRFAIFPAHVSKLLCLPRKSDARSYEVLHLSRKIISANPKIWCSKMQPISGNQRPDLLTALMNMSLVLRLPRKMHLCRSSSNVPRLPSFLEMLQNPHILVTFDKVHNPLRLPRESTSERPKVARTNMWCFVHFDFEMCFAPQRRALFRHLNFQKWSEHGVFCACWLRNVLRATTACTFSTSQLPKVVRTWRVLYILTSKCASRHNGVHFFDIATSKSSLNVRCF